MFSLIEGTIQFDAHGEVRCPSWSIRDDVRRLLSADIAFHYEDVEISFVHCAAMEFFSDLATELYSLRVIQPEGGCLLLPDYSEIWQLVPEGDSIKVSGNLLKRDIYINQNVLENSVWSEMRALLIAYQREFPFQEDVITLTHSLVVQSAH